jgi:hypothetical protein
VYRATGGRTSLSGLLSGLPVLLLVTTGARTGQPRSVLLLAPYDADRVVVTAANWGRRHNWWPTRPKGRSGSDCGKGLVPS